MNIGKADQNGPRFVNLCFILWLTTQTKASPLTPDWLLCGWVWVAVGVLRNIHSAFSNLNGCVIPLAKINLPSHQQSCRVSPLLLVLLTASWSIGGLISWWDSFDYIQKKHVNAINSPDELSPHAICRAMGQKNEGHRCYLLLIHYLHSRCVIGATQPS